MLRFAFFLLSILTLSAAAQAQEYQRFIADDVRICDAEPGSLTPPDFSGPECDTVQFYQADPQNRMVWIELVFEAEPALLEVNKPLGLFVSAKASSEAILNNVSIGANGRPGATQLAEVAGDMDAVFFVSEGTLRPGTNRLVMRLSSMNGGIILASPIHDIRIAPYRDPRKPGPATWLALVTFGLFVAGFVFFGVSSLRGNDREASAWIAALSLAAALQLAAEGAREILPYPYPLHDLRLALILAFAIALGISFVGYVLLLLFGPHPRRRMLGLGAVLIIMLVIAAWVPGFDTKTGNVLITAALAAGTSGLVAHFAGNSKGLWFALMGAVIAVLVVWLRGFFLDVVLYLIVAASLLWLLFNHARGRHGQELVAPDAASGIPKRIELTSNGKVEFVDAADIVRFSGAGDYVEVFLTSGRSALHNASLAALERDLSDGFIRVHRSHIVNAAFVKSLTRDSAGTGELNLTDGSVVPVSRRNMASVRDALTLG